MTYLMLCSPRTKFQKRCELYSCRELFTTSIRVRKYCREHSQYNNKDD